jgi:hypothetical protein
MAKMRARIMSARLWARRIAPLGKYARQLIGHPDTPVRQGEKHDTPIRRQASAVECGCRARPDALFVGPDAFFTDCRNQFASLTARDGIPSAYANRELVEAEGLMSYGTDLADMFHQVGVYTGSILKGTKPADLPEGANHQRRRDPPGELSIDR